jgi:c-di-GMP-binding flagellar brake protein YcgR
VDEMINLQSVVNFGWLMSPRNDNFPINVANPVPTVEEVDKFRVDSNIEIIYILRSMMKANALTTLTFGNSDGFILTNIIDIDLKHREVIFDYGTNQASNRCALKADTFNVFTLLNRVEIQFVCHDIVKIKFEGKSAFRARIPESLLRLQKREHYRIDMPVNRSLKCKVPLPEGDYAEVVLQNISRGGMAVLDPDHRVDFESGADYQGCLLDLPSIGTIKLNLQVKSVSEITQRGGIKCLRAGLQFDEDTEEKTLSMIQRYVMQLQMERKRTH